MSKKDETVLTITRKKVEEEGILISEGMTRKVYELNGKIYKVCYNKRDYVDMFSDRECYGYMDRDVKQYYAAKMSSDSIVNNINEFTLYCKNKDKYNFLNPTTRAKNNFKIIEQERVNCEAVIELVKEITNVCCVADNDILNLMKQGRLSNYMDFTYEEVVEFINKNNIEHREIKLVKQWGLNKDGYLRLCDYGR